MLWEPKRRIETVFQNNLRQLASDIILRVGDDSDVEVIKRTLKIIANSPQFIKFAQASALKMVTHLFADQGRTWREAAKYNSRGQEIYSALRKELRGKTGELVMQQVLRNAAIIKTLPLEIAEDVNRYVAAESLKGRRASDISKEIQEKFPKQTKARADLIARTEVSKTQSALTESRCKQFNIKWYVWRSVGGARGDGRTRDSHKKMADIIVNWNEPPAPEDLFPTIGKTGRRYHNTLGYYHAGCCPNCRCYSEPIIELDMFNWPMRIYRNGSISRISKKNFMKLMTV